MKMIGLARLGADAELRYTTSQEPVASLNLAFNYGRPGEDNQKPTQWINATLWGKRAESTIDYLKKGTLLCVTLSDPHIEQWTGKDGKTGVTLKATMQDFEFSGGKREETPSDKPKTDTPSHANGNFDDDIPF